MFPPKWCYLLVSSRRGCLGDGGSSPSDWEHRGYPNGIRREAEPPNSSTPFTKATTISPVSSLFLTCPFLPQRHAVRVTSVHTHIHSPSTTHNTQGTDTGTYTMYDGRRGRKVRGNTRSVVARCVGCELSRYRGWGKARLGENGGENTRRCG